ncbi:MAG TPA: carboxypeptidase regulatory-like domain-containing protein [Chitinophagaceae bacterium]|nr:carboxypeptidase regulatory-like domain-containing protein [Chitinophagaceae bacterium]
MHLLRSILLITLSSLFALKGIAQTLTQTIRGRIVDADSRSKVADANIIIPGSSPLIGTSSDSNGNFKLTDVPVGRQNLRISLPGYEEKLMPNLLIVAGKETVLEIALRESFTGLKDVVVTSRPDKSRVANDMAVVSARSFSVEETKRYAGAINDPARMVASYAGVNSDGSGNNDIIVRGNNPRNIQWRLEGVEIPNPNHFASEGLTGGPINALNSQMLANSEFYTGAFNPQYGNALAGIFDMKLRTGNNEKREYSFSAGVLGTDFTMEGPFKKGGKSSYLVNYRYSTLAFLDQLKIVDFNGVPKYQDGSFKIFLPTKHFGNFTVFGLGGRSTIKLENFDEVQEDKLIERMNQTSKLAVAGVSQYLPLNDKIYLRNTISFSNNGSKGVSERPTDTMGFREYFSANLNNNVARVASTLNMKLNARNQVQAGLIYSAYFFDFKSKYFDEPTQTYITEQSNKGDAGLIQGFVSWRWRITPQITLVNGLHTQKTSLNDQLSIEPRSALRYDFAGNQALTAGFGIHSKMDALPNYFALVNGTTPNSHMGLAKARHYVLGYENKLSKQLFMKVEAYYQDLYNIGIENSKTSTYSLLNQDEMFTSRALVNQGKGRNMGLELTLERYFHKNYYFLVTGSVFDSKYVAGDGIWRNTRYNGNFTSNFLFGKEFILRSKNGRNRVLGINTRTSFLGGRRLLPIDLAASQAAGRPVYIDNKAFEQKNDDVFSINLGIVYRMDRKRTSHEIKLDIQNITGNSADIDYYYNSTTGKISSIKQLSTLPVLSYTINF